MGEIFKVKRCGSVRDFSADQLTTSVSSQAEIERSHRYLLARDLSRDKDVLDVACGNGDGSALLSQVAHSVIAIDSRPKSAPRGTRSYAKSNLRFVAGDLLSIPLRDASIDIAVSFETTQLAYQLDALVAEIRRVLRPGGLLVISTLDKDTYKPSDSAADRFQPGGLTREEFTAALHRVFPHVTRLSQRAMTGSAILPDPSALGYLGQSITFERVGEDRFELSKGLGGAPYVIGLASDQPISSLITALFIESGDLMTRELQLAAVREQLERERRQATKFQHQVADLREGNRRLIADSKLLRSGSAAVQREITAIQHELARLRAENKTFDEEIIFHRNEKTRLVANVESVQKENADLRWQIHLSLNSFQLLREEVYRLWNSTSWRLFQPLRNLARRMRGDGKETEPFLASEADAIRTAVAIRQSLSWELTAPLRIVHRIVSRRAPHPPASPDVQPQIATPAERVQVVIELEPVATAPPEERVEERSPWEELLARGALLPSHTAATGTSKPRILFASHEASRTGAPLVLLSLLQHFAQAGQYELYVFCDRSGPLLEEFSKYAHVVDCSEQDLIEDSPSIYDLIEAWEDRPILAICNTSLVNHFGHAFKKLGLTVITLVHEMVDRSKEHLFEGIYQSSDRVVFVAEFVREAAHRWSQLSREKSLVIRPGLRDQNFILSNNQEARIAVLEELDFTEDAFLVLGCGTLDLRKGIDLFVQLAYKVSCLSVDAPIRFVWLGADSSDLAHWMKDDIRAQGLTHSLRLVGERDSPVAFFKAANAFVLTSREDPFPCVVLEAMASETPVIAFGGVGGAPEALDAGCGVVVPYGDLTGMAEAVIKLYRDREATSRMARSAKAKVLETYNFQDYFGAIARLARDELGVPLAGGEVREPRPASTKSREDWENHDLRTIQRDADFDLEFFLQPTAPRISRDDAIRVFVRDCATTGGGRKPYSGFNQQIYAERAMGPQERERRNPLSHFIERAKPRGPWLIPLIRESGSSPGTTRLSTALHVHAYYPELVNDLCGCLLANQSKCDLFVSTPHANEIPLLERELASYDRGEVRITTVPNRGRDIGPFVTEYAWLSREYDLVGHLHCKKTPQYSAEIGETWRRFLWSNLVGGSYPMLDLIARRFEDDPSLGLVFPDDPHIVGWTSNKAAAVRLGKRFGLNEDLPLAFEFPVGTMFWCRGAALRPLYELGLKWDDYPTEPLPIDGTLLHVIERLLPFVAEQQGFRVAATHVAGIGR